MTILITLNIGDNLYIMIIIIICKIIVIRLDWHCALQFTFVQ